MNAKPTVHIVDDDDAVRDSIGIMLGVDGFAVRVYASCAAFLRDARLDDNSCLIVDMHMPGMSGLDLLLRLRADGVKIPAVVITARSGDGLRQAVGRAGAIFVEKPFQFQELILQFRQRSSKKVFKKQENIPITRFREVYPEI